MCRSHPQCLILPASNRWCSRAGKVSPCLLSRGCGKLLGLNKLQFLPKIITVVGQELGALRTQGIVFACVKRGWGQQLPFSLSAHTHSPWHRPPVPSYIFQGKACHSPGPHHPPSTLKSEGKAYLYKYKVWGRATPCPVTMQGRGMKYTLKGIRERGCPWDETAWARGPGAVVAGRMLTIYSPRLYWDGA